MDLNYSARELDFQSEVRAFLVDDLPAAIASTVRAGDGLTKEMMDEWHSILNKKGWLATTWNPLPLDYTKRCVKIIWRTACGQLRMLENDLLNWEFQFYNRQVDMRSTLMRKLGCRTFHKNNTLDGRLQMFYTKRVEFAPAKLEVSCSVNSQMAPKNSVTKS